MKIKWGDWLTKEEYENRSIKKGDVVELNEAQSFSGESAIGYATYVIISKHNLNSSDTKVDSESGDKLFLPTFIDGGSANIPRVRIGKIVMDDSCPTGTELKNVVVEGEDGDTLEFNTLIKSNYGWVGVEKNSGNIEAEIEDDSILSFDTCAIMEII